MLRLQDYHHLQSLKSLFTTFPGSPVDKINRVEETFNEIRNMVVNNNSVGKNDISSTSFANNALKRIIIAREILIASMTSNKIEGIGIIKNMTAARDRLLHQNPLFHSGFLLSFKFVLISAF